MYERTHFCCTGSVETMTKSSADQPESTLVSGKSNHTNNANGTNTNDNSNPQQGSRYNSDFEDVRTLAAKGQENQRIPPQGNKMTERNVENKGVDSSNPQEKLSQMKIPPNKKDNRKLFIGGIPGNVSDLEFRRFFEQFGTVIDSVVMFDRETRRSRGFGFVTFEDTAVAQNVLNSGARASEFTERKVGHVTINGKICEVKAAEPKVLSQPDVPMRLGTRNQVRTGIHKVGGTFRANYARRLEQRPSAAPQDNISGGGKSTSVLEKDGTASERQKEIFDDNAAGGGPGVAPQQTPSVIPSLRSGTACPAGPTEPPQYNAAYQGPFQRSPDVFLPSPVHGYYHSPSIAPYCGMQNPYQQYNTHPNFVPNQPAYFPSPALPTTPPFVDQGGYYTYSNGHFADPTPTSALYGYPHAYFPHDPYLVSPPIEGGSHSWPQNMIPVPQNPNSAHLHQEYFTNDVVVPNGDDERNHTPPHADSSP